MSESQSLPDSGSPVENKQENSQNETVPKHSNNDGWKTLARKVPAKVKATRTYQSPPFSKEVYNLFVSALKYGEPAYPLTKELRKAGFHTSKGTSHRKKFRRLLTRFELHVVQGALVFSPNLEEDVLVHKRTGKILVAKEDVEAVILRAHLWGSNEVADERMDTKKCKHFTVRQTHAVLDKTFFLKDKEFGISRRLIERAIYRCSTCNQGRLLPDEDITLKQLENADENTSCVEEKFPSLRKTVDSSKQMLTHKDSCLKQLEKARFPSMVAHVPDKTCIWYDRKSIADTTDRFEKMLMVFGEMRGEMGLAIKGDAESKQRLEAKLYCAQLLIKDHAKNIQKSLIFEESPKVFRTELDALKQDYEQSGQMSIFNSDVAELLAHVKTHKLVMSPLIVAEIEQFVKVQNDKTDSVEGR